MPEGPHVATAIAEIAGQLEQIAKREVKAGGGGTYAAFSVDDVYNAVRPLLASNGLALFPVGAHVEYVEHQSSRGTTLTTARYHGRWILVSSIDGSEQKIGFSVESRDAGDKSTIQAAQQALKYAFVQLFQLSAGDPTPEEVPEDAHTKKEEAAEFVTKAQAKAQADEDSRRLEAAVKAHLLELAEGEVKEAKQMWPLLLEKAGLKPKGRKPQVHTVEERDKLIEMAGAMFTEDQQEGGDDKDGNG